jgi:hypothetical protein
MWSLNELVAAVDRAVEAMRITASLAKNHRRLDGVGTRLAGVRARPSAHVRGRGRERAGQTNGSIASSWRLASATAER